MPVSLKITDKSLPEFKNIKALYKKAFPAEERAPFWVLNRNARKEGVDFWGLYDDKEWVGLAYVISYSDLSYVFYLAISDRHRGKGYGSDTLRALKERYEGQKLFLAIEELDETADNYAERVSRKQFYLRGGLTELHCRLREAKVIYEVLGTGGKVEPEEYKQMMRHYLGPVLSRLVRMEIIP